MAMGKQESSKLTRRLDNEVQRLAV